MRNRIFNNLIIFLMVLVAVTTSLFCGCNQPTSTDPLEGLSVTPLTADDFLSADGDELKNQNGETVLLNGVNLGGWLHFEGWMDGGGLGYDADGEEIWMNHYAVVTALSDRFGAERTEELLSCYQQNYITEYDLRFIRSLGLNFVRVPFFWTEIMDFEGQIKANAFTQLDWVIEECSKLGMYVLLDLHGAPGGHSNGAVTGGHTDSNEFWTNTTYQQWTIDIWKALANRYKDNPAVYGYDLLNEPMPPDATTPPEADADVPSTTHDIYDMLYDAVREVDDRHIVVLEAFWHCGFLGDPKDSGWENVVYQMHMYHDSDKSERTQLDFANYYINYIKEHKESWNVPFLVGEYNFWSAESAWRTWLNTFNVEGVSWCSWTYKNTDSVKANNWGYFYCPTVENVDYKTDDFETIKRKWSGYKTSSYQKNEFLTAIIKECAFYNVVDYGTPLSTHKFTIETYKTAGESKNVHLIDGELATRWTNGEAQSNSLPQTITIRFGDKIDLKRIRIFTPNADYGRSYVLTLVHTETGKTVRITMDGKVGYTDFELSAPTRAITLTQSGEAANNFWSIHELVFFGEVING